MQDFDTSGFFALFVIQWLRWGKVQEMRICRQENAMAI